MFYNLTTNSFTEKVPNVNETDFLRITICEHRNEQVVTLISFGEEPLCLHNEDEETDKIAVELFANKNEEFKNHVDFFKDYFGN
jgi:hypothetical protein